jgi:hypothetical protein
MVATLETMAWFMSVEHVNGAMFDPAEPHVVQRGLSA